MIHIILIHANKNDAREICEGMQDTTFSDVNQLSETFKTKLQAYTLSEFMDMCNNEEFDVRNYFISYVDITNN